MADHTPVTCEGNFRIDIPQSGRYTLETSYMGYEPNVVKEVLVAGVKEVVIDIQLRENNTELTEVVVRPRVNKEATVNPAVLTGGVMLSMEEASRFAGGYNDPARLVMSFAGISGEADGSGLSIHGNAPERMQYRIEGVGVFYSEKKNFYITLQLVTRNAASYCGSYRYSGDSFQNTRHPLITQILVSC